MDGTRPHRQIRVATAAACALVLLTLGSLAAAPAFAAWGLVREFGMEGAAELSYPTGIALSPTGHVYVADTDNHRIVRFDATGDYVSAFGSKGTGPGQFNQPAGVAVAPDGNVVVADTLNHRVQKFTAGGTHLATWQPADPDRLYFPNGIAVGPGDVVYVTNTGDPMVESPPERIVKLRASDGTVVGSVGGSGEGRLSYPRTVAVDPAGTTYVGDDLQRVLRFSPDGTFEQSWRIPGRAFGLSIDPERFVWATAGGAGIPIGEYTPGGALATEIPAALPNPDPKAIFGPGAVWRPQGIATQGENAIYVVDWFDFGRVLELRRRTKVTYFHAPSDFELPFRKFLPVSVGCGSGGSGGSRAMAAAGNCTGRVEVRAEGQIVAQDSFSTQVGRVANLRIPPTRAGKRLGREGERMRLSFRAVVKPAGRKAVGFRSRGLARGAARLTLACTRPQGDLGPIAVGGALSPKLASRPIQVTYSGPGRTATVSVQTDAEGTYADSFTPDVPGQWTVWTRYAGDRRHSEALAKPCEVDVAIQTGGDAPPPPPDGPAPSDLVISALTKESFTVSNTGTAAAGPFTVRVVHSSTETTQDFSFSGLAAGASETRSFFCYPGPLTASADPDNAVAESNETNNNAERSVPSCIS